MLESFYKASKCLANESEKNNITVFNEKGNTVGSDKLKAKIIMDYFKVQFNDDPPSSLNSPITPDEVYKAINKLNNRKAPGIDNIPGEVIKTLNKPVLFEKLADIFNKSFETNTYITAIGEGILTPLAKTGKT